MEDNVSVRFLVRKIVDPLRLVILAENQLIYILDQVRASMKDNNRVITAHKM